MLTVIICTYNREQYIGQTLERLANNQFTGEWELLLIDNNCTDNTALICKDFAVAHSKLPFRYIVETKQGLSHARNRGIHEAKGDWLIFLDDDAFVSPSYLHRLEQYIHEYPEMHAFGGRIFPFFEDGERPAWLCHWTKVWLSALDKGSKVCTFQGNEYPIGANMGFSRHIVSQCGDFNTHLGRCGKNMIGGEEKDYFQRIKALHAPIYYLPEIAVDHCIPTSRTTDEYICRLGCGVGKSERQRTLAISRQKFILRLFSEAIKWCATLLLFCFYALQGAPIKGQKLILFRKNVTKGLLSK